ncbi:MAG: hypothetical protein EXR58_04630 [Chloroflexi bacterium]|nr:hypothetical protein [Chloroflexota bacterium]
MTVADALRLALPPGTRVVRGQQHLRRAVSWVRLFVTRPYQLNAIEPDALVILSLRGLDSSTQRQRLPGLIDALVAASVSAVVLTGESPEVYERAEFSDAISVLVLPKDVVLPEIERAVIALILDRTSQVERRVAEVYQELIQLALSDAPLTALATTLSQAAEQVIYLEDEYGALQALAVPDDHEARGLPSGEQALGLYSAREVLGISPSNPAGPGYSGQPIRRTLADGRHAICCAPIALGGAITGFLTILGDTDQIQDLDEQLVVRSASAFAIPIAKQRAIIETQTRIQGSFLETLFSGNLHNEDDILARASYLGHNLREPYLTACFVVDAHLFQRNGESAEPQRAALWASVLEAARRDFSDEWPRALLKDRGRSLAVLVPSTGDLPDGSFREVLDRIRVRLNRLMSDGAATCGLGPSASGPADIVRSFLQAEQAARIGGQFLGGDQTVAFDELGVYRLLASVESQTALDSFYEEFLGPLEAYDARYNGELIDTLAGFFSSNGNHARAAEALHLHRNTLLYRLSRIEALTGHDLGDSETRLSLQLALKIGHLGNRRFMRPISGERN